MRPKTMVMPDGETAWRSRWQSWDSPLTTDRQSIRLSQDVDGKLRTRRYTADPVTSFVDSSPSRYYNEKLPYHSVKTAGSGIRLSITDMTRDRSTYRVELSE